MNTTDVPTAITTFLEATNGGDSDAFAAAFTADAYLNDWGREYHGRAGVRAWDRTDNIGVQSHIDLAALDAGPAPNCCVTTVRVTGNRFNGTGQMTFELRGNLIAGLRIS